MKGLILNGAVALRDMAQAADDALAPALAARGYDVARRDLTAVEIPDCRGDFGCWTVTPGVCVHAGPHRDIARDVVRSDLLVVLTPVTFGGYSSALKRLLDHCIPLISPWFTKVDGETHHEPRYERFPGLLAVGLMETPDAAAAEVFQRLVRRNVLNMYPPGHAAAVLTRAEMPGLPALAARWLDDLAVSRTPRAKAEPLDLDAAADLPAVPARRALLLVGSPRGGQSVSAAIAAHVAALLTERGLAVSTENVGANPGALGAGMGEADVIGLIAPLYVDSLPAPVTAALEIASRSRPPDSPSRPRFMAMINCGFPEAVHTDTALAICRQFARQAGLDWIGGLGIGGGGMFAGGPLTQRGGRARNLTRALALTADAVSQGRVVPDEARRLVRKLAVPAWVYRLLADRGFRKAAKKHGALRDVDARPYAP